VVTVVPVRSNTPAPAPAAGISLDTVGEVQELAQWGGGGGPGLSFSADSSELRLNTIGGTVIINTDTWSEAGWLPPVAPRTPQAPVYDWRYADGSTVIFRTGDQSVVATLAGAGTPLFMPDGQTVITGMAGKQITAWRIEGGEKLWVSQALDGYWQGSSDVSEDGTLFAVATTEFGWVYVWRVADGTLVQAFDTGTHTAYGSEFSPDGRYVAAINLHGGISMWRLGDGELAYGFGGASASWQESSGWIEIAPDNSMVAAAFGNGEVLAWETSRPGQPILLKPVAPTGQAIEFSADSQLLAVASRGRVMVWEVGSGAMLPYVPATAGHTSAKLSPFAPVRLSGPSGLILDIAFAPDGMSVVAVADNAPPVLEQWQLTGQGVREPGNLNEAPTCWQLAYSHDGRRLACALAASVEVWDADDTKAGAPGQPGDFTDVSDLAFSTDDEALAVSFYSGQVKWLDAVTGAVKAQVQTLGAALQVEFLGDDGLLFIETVEGGELWDLVDAQRLVTIDKGIDQTQNFENNAFPFYASGLALSPDGTVLAMASGPRIQLRWASDMTLLRVLTGHARAITGLAFSPDGRYLASGAVDGTIRLWGTAPAESAP